MATQTSTTGGTASGARMGAGGSQGQGASDVTYNLVSVLYHTLQACQTYEQYAQDAQQAGHQDVAQYFRDVQQQARQTADRGQQLLMQCLQSEQGGRSGQQMHSQGMGGGQQGAGGSMQESGSSQQSAGGAMQGGSSQQRGGR
ncbi:MAG TPA: hypothetical protein VGI14_16035 [Casimicrobiaceae bacterium]